MKSLVFDSSSVISLATSNLLWTLKLLKGKFKGEFLITKYVKEELVDKPLRGKKYRLEALMISGLLDGVLRVVSNKRLDKKMNYLIDLCDRIFKSKGKFIKLIHEGEVSSLGLCCLNNGCFVVDERSTRMLIENPRKLGFLLEKKLHSKVLINEDNLKMFVDEVKDVSVIRSTELMTIAFEKGFFKNKVRGSRRDLLSGLLWSLKLRGCSISTDEINEIMNLERV